jgi:hypothetical protein
LRCSVLKVTLKDTRKYVLARGCDYHNFVHRFNQAAEHQASIKKKQKKKKNQHLRITEYHLCFSHSYILFVTSNFKSMTTGMM